ncbi:MAG: hypothetical protein AB8B63_22350 [Granulosicoccus sp.]
MQKVLAKPAQTRKERRRYVRAHDAVGLHLQRLLEIPAAGQASVPVQSAKVRKQDKYQIDGYSSVRAHYPAVAEYIGQLEERIRQLLLDADEPPESPTHKVNMSAGGICFTDDQVFYPEEMLSVCMTLFPTGRRIVSDAIVISANDVDYKESAGDRPTYRLEFVRMAEADRRVLETHVDQLLTKRELLED